MLQPRSALCIVWSVRKLWQVTCSCCSSSLGANQIPLCSGLWGAESNKGGVTWRGGRTKDGRGQRSLLGT